MLGPAAMEQEDFGGESAALAWVKRRLPHWLYEALELAYCLLDYSRLVVAMIGYKPDLIYERFNLFLPSGIWARKLFGTPLFLEVNAPLFEERSAHGGIGLRRLAKWTQHYAWRGATKCFPVTRVLAGYLREAGVPEDNIVVIPNGINEAMFCVDDSDEGLGDLLPRAFQGSTICGFVGFVRSWHGIEKLLDVIADPELAAERLTLLVVGDGPARGALEEHAKALAVSDRIHFTGIVARDKIRPYVRLFDIALQPNVVSYASPLKLFEYLALGRAILAPDVPNIREVLTDGQNALLFDQEDPGSLKRALVRLTKDPALRARLGEAARNTIGQRGYTWAHNAERITRVFAAARSAVDSGGRHVR